MKYLKFIDQTTTTLTTEEEAYLDAQLAFEAWCKKNQGQHGRSIHITEAIQIFENELFSLCCNHISFGDNVKHWKNILIQLEDKKALKFNEKIRQAKTIPMDQLASRMGYSPNRHGMCQSPFLDGQRTGSMKIYMQTNTWFDFGTNQGGDTIYFIQAVKNCEFKEAVNYLV